MEKSYDILFAAQLVEGFDEASVRAQLAELFKANEATLDKLFSGQPQLIKRGVDKATAAKYRNAMHRAGAVALIKASATAAAPAQPQAPAPANDQPQQEKPQTMAERLAALTGEESPREPEPQAEQPAATPESTAAADSAEPAARTAQGAPAGELTADSGLSLAPAGADVLQDEERETVVPVAVDTSALQVDDSDTDIPSLPRFEETPEAPDTSHLSLGEAGEMIPHLDSGLEPLDIDTSAIDLAPEGSDFSDCAPPPAAAVEPDLSGVELAPQGSDMLEEQYRRKDQATAPNVDHIALADDQAIP